LSRTWKSWIYHNKIHFLVVVFSGMCGLWIEPQAATHIMVNNFIFNDASWYLTKLITLL